MLHPTAVIGDKVDLGENVFVGPCVVIDGEVRLGDRCRIGPHVYLTGKTKLGEDNVLHSGCVIGDSPQDARYSGEPSETIIGSRNTFREHVTVHRSNTEQEATIIGSDNLFMAGSHIGHNAEIGNHVVLANSALIGGHAAIEDNVFIGGNASIHQFVRIGRLAFLQGNSGLSQDLPPFLIACRLNELGGLNTVGLRRAGITPEDRLQLKKLYHALFRQGLPLSVAMEQAKKQYAGEPLGQELLAFIRRSRRGVCSKSRH